MITQLLVRLKFYVNSYTVSLPFLNTVLRLPGSQVLKFVILTKSSQCLLICSVAFSNGILFSQLFFMCTWPSRNCIIIAPKWGIPNGNHMNDDVTEVNGSAPPKLPGSFLHKKEPGYVAKLSVNYPSKPKSFIMTPSRRRICKPLARGSGVTLARQFLKDM